MHSIESNIENTTLKPNIKNKFIYFIKNHFIFLVTLVSLFLKSLFFLAYVASPTGTKISLSKLPIYLVNILLYVSILAIFISICYMFKGKKQITAFLTMNFAISLFMLCDLIYYRGFQSFISIYNLSQKGNLENLSSTIISLIRPWDIIFFLDIFILAYLLIRYRKNFILPKRRLTLSICILIISILVPSYYHYTYDILQKAGPNKKYFHIYWSPLYNISKMSPIGYHVYDSYLYFKNSKRLSLTNEDKNTINEWFLAAKEDLPDNKYAGIFKGKNLIFIQVESLERFVIGKRVNGEEITPTLNKILKNSFYFSSIYEQVSGGNSSDADLMVNTSTYPVKNGATFFRFPDNKYNSLPMMMKKLGYYTSAFHPDGGGYWNWMPALQSMEFDKCTDITGFKVDETIGLGISDGSYLRQLADKISNQPKPFYSFFVTLTSHMPFNLPKEHRYMNLPDSMDKNVLGDYLQSIHYTDKHIGNFLDKLDESGVLDDSVVVIYGDHCGVHKYYKDKLNKIQPREDWWFKNDYEIPLIIYSKDLKGKEIKTIGGHIDILPTAAYLMGVDKKEYIHTSMGRNLLNTNKNFVVLSNGVFIGNYDNEMDKKTLVQGLDISDIMLRSNYFKNYYKK
ncbi:LTA synthase family protein [Clostridium cochlearium]|uniref:LTA synthase family protein n=1 Tax=Clostridium cochlearium TaxID=1494 RepID=UPI00156D71AC|nr:LTA synthase family protein [Clostridium cochlearium]MBV1820368.1 LTA synthase family protein [Bacteroidales bacterium MSK.15.36]MCG4572372.1 LTA synthase family protein [Clostridium cochlearium]MCG4580135.1 LTA synthase family protein [Clostridium cochlearium]NSJ91402.1 LTA synthase family protein [Coprococcus sp. MSK.21.13]